MNAPTPTIPAADATRESYGDWLLTCANQHLDGQIRRVIVLSQEQFHKETRQRVLAVELRWEAKSAKGSLVLPFGLHIPEGARLVLDGENSFATLSFHTALPIGIVANLEFDGKALAALSKGKLLKIEAVTHDTGQEVNLAVSLKGFATAFARMEALAR
ncbi:invasion-like protein [Phyllobacterium phragmitis]|uniref:Invasion-like protein n=1 Tax=Phyllobacterium phragmitis TaxID=2670329 RepID=A0A2S9ILC0_9HYPH|nr:invasion associated locus B family protein [Phyllobacterium phragmitis]PRD41295.1 invasion-like protein [Phyllobacterium phragmitis]